MARLPLARLEAFRYGGEHLGADEDVTLGDIVRSGAMPGPRRGARAGMLRRASFDVDHADLSRGRAGVGGEQAFERVFRCVALRERVEQLVAVFSARVRLRRDGADAFPYPRHAVADARDARGDG